MRPDQQRLSSEDRSNLVAYLDGELDDGQARVIATKLTQSLTARSEVEALRKTWELLDVLPRPRASEDFTARTLSVAANGGGPGDRVASAASAMARRVAVTLACSLGMAALFVLAYQATLRAWPNPSARLARDLTIAESLDEYRDVGSLEYLDRIDSAPDFN